MAAAQSKGGSDDKKVQAAIAEFGKECGSLEKAVGELGKIQDQLKKDPKGAKDVDKVLANVSQIVLSLQKLSKGLTKGG